MATRSQLYRTIEEGVQQENALWQDRLHVQQHCFWWPIEVVGGELRLDHDLHTAQEGGVS